jgi:hypothetical protein
MRYFKFYLHAMAETQYIFYTLAHVNSDITVIKNTLPVVRF